MTAWYLTRSGRVTQRPGPSDPARYWCQEGDTKWQPIDTRPTQAKTTTTPTMFEGERDGRAATDTALPE